MTMRVLTVPGYTGSGPDHWQSHLERQYRDVTRVEQDDWSTVDRERWIDRLDEAVSAHPGPVFLVGHSCGAVTIVQWAVERSAHRQAVVGALLVAPADVEAPGALPAIASQGRIPRERLPFPCHLVVGSNDPLMSCERALEFGRAWGSTVEILPAGGHIATADGFGRWPEVVRTIEQRSGYALSPQPCGRVS